MNFPMSFLLIFSVYLKCAIENAIIFVFRGARKRKKVDQKEVRGRYFYNFQYPCYPFVQSSVPTDVRRLPDQPDWYSRARTVR